MFKELKEKSDKYKESYTGENFKNALHLAFNLGMKVAEETIIERLENESKEENDRFIIAGIFKSIGIISGNYDEINKKMV
jgi:hypothetical protein